MSRLFIGMIRLYQASLSRLLGGCCRFHPSCSEYCVQAIRAHGWLRGALMGVGRVLRCNPLYRGGYDPVPQAGNARSNA